jgi:hypothetical protein
MKKELSSIKFIWLRRIRSSPKSSKRKVQTRRRKSRTIRTRTTKMTKRRRIMIKTTIRTKHSKNQ